MLLSLKEILDDAYKHKYAVGAFNCLSLENVIGAIEAAEELHSPIILQLAEVQFPYAPLELMGPMFLEVARKTHVPVAVHLDHGQSFYTCAKAIKLGFNSVMIDSSILPLNRNIEKTKEVVQMANAMGVCVEAELGHVGDTGEDPGETGNIIVADMFTDVEESAYFVQNTKVDALAISIGNQHGKYIHTPKLNIQRVKDIKDKTNIPLVLHGGSGTCEQDFKNCIYNGISKINVATAIQLCVAQELDNYLNSTKKPNYIEMKSIIVNASKNVVAYHMKLFESENRC